MFISLDTSHGINTIDQAIESFCLAADTNDDLPSLKNKTWMDYRLSSSEWKLIQLVHNCLEVCFLLRIRDFAVLVAHIEFCRQLLRVTMNFPTRPGQHVQGYY